MNREIEGVPEALVSRHAIRIEPDRNVDITVRPAQDERSMEQGQRDFRTSLQLALQAYDNALTIHFWSCHRPILAPARIETRQGRSAGGAHRARDAISSIAWGCSVLIVRPVIPQSAQAR
jgi:hypothetical protein